MSLHDSKQTALVQLCNCMSVCNLKNLQDLCNGDIFIDIIAASFPDFEQAKQPQITESEKILNEKKKEEVENKNVIEDTETHILKVKCEEGLEMDTTCTPAEMSPVDIINKCFENTEDLHHSYLDSVGANEEKIIQNYKLIQKFIDDKYSLQSEDIISYIACMEGKELELAKVAFFLLSEVVKLCIALNNNQLSTLALLDSRVQEDLEECFKLFILERECLSKSSVEKVLCNQARYKTPSPVIRNSFITPRRSCASKYRIEFQTTPSTDDVFTNSPLKSFFESPVFKEDLIRKDKEIAETRNILYEEEMRVEDLKKEVNDLKKQLLKKDVDIKKLKGNVKELRESEKIKDEDIIKLITERNEYTEKFEAVKKEYEVENSQLMTQINLMEKEVKNCLNGTCNSQNVIRDLMLLKEDMKRKTHIAQKLQEELKIYKEMVKVKTKELNEVKDHLRNVTFDKMKNESLYKEKINGMNTEKKEEPNSPGSGEIIGSIIEEENKMIRLKLNKAESKIKELEEKLEKFEMIEKDCIPTHQDTGSMPDLVDISELHGPQNLPDSQNEKELRDSLNMCDMSSSSEIVSKNSFNDCDIASNSGDASNHSFSKCDILRNSEGVSNYSFTGCDNSRNSEVTRNQLRSSEHHWTEIPFADPTVELYGTLWKNLNFDSENEVSCDRESNGSEDKNTIGSLTFYEFLNLLKMSSINITDRCNSTGIFADKKSDAAYISSILKGKISKEKVSKLVKDYRIFKELLLCLFIFVGSNATTPTNHDFYDWAKILENGHKNSYEKSELEKKFAIQLQDKENQIESLERNCCIFQEQLEQYKIELQERCKRIEDLESKCRKKEDIAKLFISKYEKCKERLLPLMDLEKNKNYLYQKIEFLESEKKILSKKYNDCISRKDQNIHDLRTRIDQLKTINAAKEKQEMKLLNERDKYLLKAKELAKTLRDKDYALLSNHGKNRIKNYSNNDLEYVTEQSLPQMSRREIWNVSHMSASFYPDCNSSVSRDFNNESTLSGALYSKSGLVGQFVSQDEESFFNQSSLEEIKQVTKDDRLDELMYRNSLCAPLLKSSYPLELDLTPSANKKLFSKKEGGAENSKAYSEQLDSKTKKRKIEEVEPETQSNEVFRTPLMKMKQSIRNSWSFKKTFSSRRPSIIKPKP